MNQAFSVLLTLLVSMTVAFASPPQQAGATAPSSASAPQSAPAADTFQENVTYATVNGTVLHLDVYEPPERGHQTRPAVVLIHGGAWTSFDKSTMSGMGRFLSHSGFVAFAVDYRLFNGAENRWPAQLDDVQRAVRWVRANAAKYGVNPDRIGAFGHSAGAQLAALLGMEDTRDNSDPGLAKYSSKVQAVVDVSGPADFTTDHDADRDAFLTSFLGADYEKHPELWREASPVFHVAKTDAPFLIVHGTQDQDVPISQSQELYDKLHSTGVPVSLIKVGDVHTFQTQEARHRMVTETLEFFNRYLVVAR
jgi:acetyl esterase/lipase